MVFVGCWWFIVVFSSFWQVMVVFGVLLSFPGGSCWFLLFFAGCRDLLMNIGFFVLFGGS